MTVSEQERKVRSSLKFTRFIVAYMPLPMMRWVMKLGMNRYKPPTGVTHEVVMTDGVRCEWLIPEGSPSDKVLLYIHGGGFILGMSPLHNDMVAYLAKQMGVRALMVDYRLAPEHPFPAGLDDCVTAYRWLLKQGYSADNIVISGDSAGGNFTIATLMKLRDEGDPLPAAAAPIAPVIDLVDRENPDNPVYDDVLHPKARQLMRWSYIGDSDPKNPLLSPAYNDWHDLPPLLVQAGEDEILCEDAVRIGELASEAGVDVQVEIYPNMWHVWHIQLQLKRSKQALSDIATFLNGHLES